MKSKYMHKMLLYVLGLALMAIGVMLSVRSDLGISPVNSIAYVVSVLSGIEQGYVTSVYFCLFIALQVVVYKDALKPSLILQFVFSIIFGYFLLFFNSLFSFSVPDLLINRFLMLSASIVIISIGLFLYLEADLVPMPAEGLLLALVRRSGRPFSKIKVLFDCTIVALTILISFLGSGGLIGVGIGTVTAAIGIGWVTGIVRKVLQPLTNTILCPE